MYEVSFSTLHACVYYSVTETRVYEWWWRGREGDDTAAVAASSTLVCMYTCISHAIRLLVRHGRHKTACPGVSTSVPTCFRSLKGDWHSRNMNYCCVQLLRKCKQIEGLDGQKPATAAYRIKSCLVITISHASFNLSPDMIMYMKF